MSDEKKTVPQNIGSDVSTESETPKATSTTKVKVAPAAAKSPAKQSAVDSVEAESKEVENTKTKTTKKAAEAEVQEDLVSEQQVPVKAKKTATKSSTTTKKASTTKTTKRTTRSSKVQKAEAETQAAELASELASGEEVVAAEAPTAKKTTAKKATTKKTTASATTKAAAKKPTAKKTAAKKTTATKTTTRKKKVEEPAEVAEPQTSSEEAKVSVAEVVAEAKTEKVEEVTATEPVKKPRKTSAKTASATTKKATSKTASTTRKTTRKTKAEKEAEAKAAELAEATESETAEVLEVKEAEAESAKAPKPAAKKTTRTTRKKKVEESEPTEPVKVAEAESVSAEAEEEPVQKPKRTTKKAATGKTSTSKTTTKKTAAKKTTTKKASTSTTKKATAGRKKKEAELVETEPVQAETPVELESEKVPAVEIKEEAGQVELISEVPESKPIEEVEDWLPGQIEEDNEVEQDVTSEQAMVIAQLKKLGRPVHVRDLERTFTRQALDRLGGWRDLEDLLSELVETGEVIRTRRRTYGLPEAMSLVRGRFQASASGFGFVIPDSGDEDYYISPDRTMEAWNGDIVMVRMDGRGDSKRGGGPRRGQKGDGNPRATVVRIVERAYTQLVGTLEYHHGHPMLHPDDHRARHRILVFPEGLDDLEPGARVVTELYWPENTGEDEVFGQVVRVLGEQDDPETETKAVIVKYGLRGEFPEEIMAEAAAIPCQIPEEALVERLDLREFNTFTVDGRDAKDFDDAIHIQPTPEGNFVVGVHIADVSHYVQEGSALDKEAYARATSVYLPGRVLPMLPEHLSNGVCSLVPHEDRLTLTALVELSAEGDILDVKIAPSIINSKARLTYDEVQAYSEAKATLPDHARHLEGDLHLLLKITSKLRQQRLREGSLDFKLREVKVDVDSDGRMELIPIREETARGMIEDLMLLANKVVARYLLEREIPSLFRIHEEPTLQRFQEVTGAIGRLGLGFPGGEPTPRAYQAVLTKVRGTSRESVVNTLLLRSMQQAKYAAENLGHFGLAFPEYLHFTSPIRRYPDLVVHRTIKAVQNGDFKAGNREVSAFAARLPQMGEHTSDRERTATEAERDLTKYYQAKWAKEHLGQSFRGNVSGVLSSGLFVALDNGVEGKLHISNLTDDYYAFIEDAQMLKGRSNGQSYRLGDEILVTISSVSPLARQTDFVLADPTDPEYVAGDIPQENNTMDSNVKIRARRREDREQERQEKLKNLPISTPKFTLDDPQTDVQVSPRSHNHPKQQKRSNRSRGRNGASRQDHGGGRSFGGRGSKRVITLERPRNEHLRPVNVTVQRLYFGDWTTDNMPPQEGQSHARGGRERGYNRKERNERGGGRGGNWTRGSNDKGAVRDLNGKSPRRNNRQTQANTPSKQAPPPPPTQAQAQDDAKRRRRRRGRRGNAGEE